MKKFLVLFLLVASVACAGDYPGTYLASSTLVTIASGSVTMLSTTGTYQRGDLITLHFRGSGYWAWGTVASEALVSYNLAATGTEVVFRWGGADMSLISLTTHVCPIVINKQRDF